METYIFSSPYQCSCIYELNITPYQWLKNTYDEIYGIYIEVEYNSYNRDMIIVQGYKIEKALREEYILNLYR
jgi:hypothetical protein